MVPALQFTDVCCDREGDRVLFDISFSTSARRIGLVGRNGSGKSSLARIITGLSKPAQGSVRVFGGDTGKDRNFALTHVGMIFQNPDQQIIFPTVFEEINFGLENLNLRAGEAENRIAETLARFGWEDKANQPVHTLSHGQKHLLCLMSVLVMDPRLIVFDEPYAGLDLPTARSMKRILHDLEQHVVVISHSMDDFKDFDELVWLEDGRLQAHGSVDTVLPQYLAAMELEPVQC